MLLSEITSLVLVALDHALYCNQTQITGYFGYVNSAVITAVMLVPVGKSDSHMGTDEELLPLL